MMLKLEKYSETEIVGAKEVWDTGGDVWVAELEKTPKDEKYSTSLMIKRILEFPVSEHQPFQYDRIEKE